MPYIVGKLRLSWFIQDHPLTHSAKVTTAIMLHTFKVFPLSTTIILWLRTFCTAHQVSILVKYEIRFLLTEILSSICQHVFSPTRNVTHTEQTIYGPFYVISWPTRASVGHVTVLFTSVSSSCFIRHHTPANQCLGWGSTCLQSQWGHVTDDNVSLIDSCSSQWTCSVKLSW